MVKEHRHWDVNTLDEQTNARMIPDDLRKVAIVGGGNTRKKAPFDDESWEIWGFSSKAWRFPRVNRWFELHAMTDLRQQLSYRKKGRRSFAGYMRFMRRLDCPVYMQKVHPTIPTSVAFPLDDVLARFGRCFTSSVSYMVALAMMEGVDVLGLWGVEVRRREYLHQRPALKYLLSLARQEGITISLPAGSTIRIPTAPRPVTTRVLYAYDWRSPGAWWRARVRRRMRRMAQRRASTRKRRIS